MWEAVKPNYDVIHCYLPWWIFLEWQGTCYSPSTFLDGSYVPLNLRYMLVSGRNIQHYTHISQAIYNTFETPIT
jgi:hypothetical protein